MKTHNAAEITPGQFMVRKPEYNGWGIAQFLRVGSPYSETVKDLFYCKDYGMQEHAFVWSWGEEDGLSAQVTAHNLRTYYQPATEAECADIAERELRARQDEWNARYPQYSRPVEIRPFAPCPLVQR